MSRKGPVCAVTLVLSLLFAGSSKAYAYCTPEELRYLQHLDNQMIWILSNSFDFRQIEMMMREAGARLSPSCYQAFVAGVPRPDPYSPYSPDGCPSGQCQNIGIPSQNQLPRPIVPDTPTETPADVCGNISEEQRQKLDVCRE